MPIAKNPDWEIAETERLALEEEYKVVLLTWQQKRKAAELVRQILESFEAAIESARKMFADADKELHDFNAKIEAANKKVRETPQTIEV